MECFFSQYGVDVDGDGIADYVVGGGGNYAGYNTTGYETGYISCSLPLCFSSFTCSRLYEPISRTDAGSSLVLSLQLHQPSSHRSRSRWRPGPPKPSRWCTVRNFAKRTHTQHQSSTRISKCQTGDLHSKISLLCVMSYSPQHLLSSSLPCVLPRCSSVNRCCILTCPPSALLVCLCFAFTVRRSPKNRFQDTVRGYNGAVIDRYVVAQRGSVAFLSFCCSLIFFLHARICF